jgi:chemotaxis protein MotB
MSGGAWKVAYADFVTAMMAFFMVMWITAQSKEVKVAVSQYFDDPLGSSHGSTSTPTDDFKGAPTYGPHMSGAGPDKGSAKAVPKSLPKADPDAKEMSKSPRLRIFHDASRTRTGGTMLLFPEDGADLSQDGKNALYALLPSLLGKPNKIEIRGHASRRPLPEGSKFSDAWDISFARCTAAMKYLIENGVQPERIRLSQGGPYEPYTVRREAEWQAQNSRIEVFLTSEYTHEFDKSKDEHGGFFGESKTE